MRDNEHDQPALPTRRPSILRWVPAVGMMLFYVHSAAHIFFLGWSEGGWKARWDSNNTLVLVLVALVALATLSAAVATRRVLCIIAYGVGVATALTPLLIYAPEGNAQPWGGLADLVWAWLSLAWAFLPAWVMSGLMWIEEKYQRAPTRVRLWDVVGGCLACVPLSGLPFWPLHRMMYVDVPWLGEPKFQVDLWLEVSAGALLIVWAFVAMVLRDREGVSS